MNLKDIIKYVNLLIASQMYKRTQSILAAGAVTTQFDQVIRSEGEIMQLTNVGDYESKDFKTSRQTEIQTPTATTADVRLDYWEDVSIGIGREELLTNKVKVKEHAQKAISAFTRKIDSQLFALGAAAATTIGDGTATAYTKDMLIQAERALNDKDVEENNRFLITNDVTKLKEGDLIAMQGQNIIINNGTNTIVSAQNPGAQMVDGFNVVTPSAKFRNADGTVNYDLAMHKGAIAFVNSPGTSSPLNAQAQENGIFHRSNVEGFTVTTAYYYDYNSKTNVLSTDILYGMKVINPDLMVKIQIKR